jgi:UDP-3-O-[3-hydroxymyristoyl] N-acetylglucosamine deacetylase
MRRTIARKITVTGTGLHAGSGVAMTLVPALPGAGIVFRRSDLGGAIVPARYDRVTETSLGTVIAEGDAKVAVVEHLMSAVAGAEIDDLEIHVDGPELPILEGDALSFLECLDRAGIVDQPGTREGIRVLRRVEAGGGDATAALEPSDRREFELEIEFPSAAIGRQHLIWQFSAEAYARDIAPARTFGFVHELDALRKAGLGRGASLENTLAIDGDKVINADRMRFADEFVRHKILDAIGDLALAGAPILGRFEGRRSGHALNNRLLRALFADAANFQRTPLP